MKKRWLLTVEITDTTEKGEEFMTRTELLAEISAGELVESAGLKAEVLDLEERQE